MSIGADPVRHADENDPVFGLFNEGGTLMTLSSILMASAGVLLIAVAATYLIPSKMHVERTAVIKADPQMVLTLAASSEGYQQFNPYASVDPDLKITPFGPASSIVFAVPDLDAMLARLPPVLEAIYGASAVDWLSDGLALTAAIGEETGPEQGLALLDRIEGEAIATYQPAWAVRAHLRDMAGDLPGACMAYDRAISLCTEPPARRWLEGQRDQIRGRMS